MFEHSQPNFITPTSRPPRHGHARTPLHCTARFVALCLWAVASVTVRRQLVSSPARPPPSPLVLSLSLPSTTPRTVRARARSRNEPRAHASRKRGHRLVLGRRTGRGTRRRSGARGLGRQWRMWLLLRSSSCCSSVSRSTTPRSFFRCSRCLRSSDTFVGRVFSE